jgi:hypothetical protein
MKQKLFHLTAIVAALIHRLAPMRTGRQCGSHRSSRLKPAIVLSNIAEGTHQSSQGITYEADVAITERFLLVKRGGAANRVAICGAADTPVGVCSDEAAAAADLVNVRPFNSDLTLIVVASAAIAQDALLEPAANGRVATLGVGVGTHHVVGRALNAAANTGDTIEMAPSYFLRVI